MKLFGFFTFLILSSIAQAAAPKGFHVSRSIEDARQGIYQGYMIVEDDGLKAVFTIALDERTTVYEAGPAECVHSSDSDSCSYPALSPAGVSLRISHKSYCVSESDTEELTTISLGELKLYVVRASAGCLSNF